MKRTLVLVSLSALIVIAATAIYSLVRPAPNVIAAETSMTERMNAAASKAAGKAVRLGSPEPVTENEPNLRAFSDESSGDEFWIDVETGQVVSWSSGRRGARTGRSVGQARAEEVAAQVQRRMAPGLGRARSKPGKIQHQTKRRTDDVRDEYLVTFDEYIDGIRTQNGMTVVVNADDGRVLSATVRSTDLDVSLIPRISVDDAIKIAEAAAHIPIHTDEYTELRVIETVNSPQALVWWVELATGDVEFGGVRTVLVDAQTGEVRNLIIGGEHIKR